MKRTTQHLLLLVFCAIAGLGWAQKLCVDSIYYIVLPGEKKQVCVTNASIYDDLTYYDSDIYPEYHDTVIVPRQVEIGGELYTVTEIGAQAFLGCRKLKYVLLPNTITKIGALAFLNCRNLSDIAIPSSVRIIDSNAFNGCYRFQRIILPEGVTTIGSAAFFKCKNLDSVRLPMTLKEIGYEAFSECCRLESIIVPDNVSRMGKRVFAGCDSLRSIHIGAGLRRWDSGNEDGNAKLERVDVSPKNKWMASVDGVLYSKRVDTLLCYPRGRKGAWVVPSTVTCIPVRFNTWTTITEIVFPPSLKSVISCPFYNLKPAPSKITFQSAEPPEIFMDNYSREGCPKRLWEVEVHVPKGSAEAYRGWMGFTNIVED